MLKKKYTLGVSVLASAIIGFYAGLGTDILQRPDKTSQSFAVYGIDIQQSTPQTELCVSFPSQLNQRQQIERLADLLSRYKFCELPINIVSLKDNIATINLSEHSWVQGQTTPPSFPGCSGKSWRYVYFQGSTGGYSTTVSLVRTFLQPQYKSQWIQGVQFSYQGQLIKEGDWDHINLDGIITRDNSPIRERLR